MSNQIYECGTTEPCYYKRGKKECEWFGKKCPDAILINENNLTIEGRGK